MALNLAQPLSEVEQHFNFDQIDSKITANRRIVTLTADITLNEAAHDGKILLLGEVGGDASLTVTLPPATGSGAVYHFIVSVVNTSDYVIQVTTTDTIDGAVWTISISDTPDLGQPWPTAATSDTITLNATTTGGVAIGDELILRDIATAQWVVIGHTTTSGTEATPFSAAVS
jgi:hypothetical protein